MTNRDLLESSISIASAVSPSFLALEADIKRASILVRVEGGKAHVEVRSEKGEYNLVLSEGDSYDFAHVVKIRATRDIETDHVFPLRIQHGADTYFLNRTKNDKLILTK